ncbi:hypothetical protein PAGA_a0531 [Pseudoalteromonas agarivorans DSM 14585]|uniref:Uncharacterized protein n=1 Tax=Pseudoalteromonas agarivorans DSM 14585 TaxID=1312369 RepID=A0ACA8DSZ9_9GAMM|nr:hypothetical protein PAGA_a0531 [Pseudoalteromonas agarivorans DSM 14585]
MPRFFVGVCILSDDGCYALYEQVSRLGLWYLQFKVLCLLQTQC